MTVNEHMNNMSVERKADFLAEIELNEIPSGTSTTNKT
jgi:hypothetical protein